MSACCFTGHREIPAEQYTELRARLAQEIETCIQTGVTEFRTGGALGFDTLAAQCVLSMKTKYPHIKLQIDVPHNGQEKRWSEKNQAIYHDILSRADGVTVLAEHYYRGCMHVRNRHMVDHSNYVIAYVRKTTGGSAYTVAYAEEQGIPVILV